MKICVSQQQMQELERDSIQNIGIPSLVLMERAALSIVECVCKCVDKSEHIFIVCGKGNNGADGVAVGRLLEQEGFFITIITIGSMSKATEEYKIQENVAKNMGMTFCEWNHWEVDKNAWIIDGIFGIGLTRNISGDYQKLIQKMQVCENIIAIDIPSGISADTGTVLGCALKAKHTVTFGYEKLGLYLNDGRMYSGEIHLKEIGFYKGSEEHINGSAARILETSDLCSIPSRQVNGNKGNFGKLLIIAGSVGMSGAAYLCGAVAYRMGAGLVKILTVEENRSILQMQLPEAIVRGYTDSTMKEALIEECNWATAIVMGPGIGQAAYVEEMVMNVMRMANENKIPLVLDSDALNAISLLPELCQYYGNHIIITPHMKEMSRLTSYSIRELKEHAIERAQSYSEKFQITCILKDAVSVIANELGEVYLTTSGNSALAKGGTGDVLAGIVGGLVCIGMEGSKAASMGSYIHGLTGTLVSKKRGMHGVLARDLIEELNILERE